MEEIIYDCQKKEELARSIQSQVEVNKAYVQQLIEVGVILKRIEIANFNNSIDVGLLTNDTNQIIFSLEMVSKQININQQQFDMTDRSIGESLNV